MRSSRDHFPSAMESVRPSSRAEMGFDRFDRQLLLGVLLLACVWAGLYQYRFGKFGGGEVFEMEIIAAHVAQGHGFASPLDRTSQSPPSSYSAPLYPLLAAGVYKLFGIYSSLSNTILLGINVLCFGLIAAGLFALGRLLFSRGAGLCAAALLLPHYYLLSFMGMLWDRMPALALFVWILVATLAIRRTRPTALRLGGLGAAMGLLSLTNASFLLAYPLVTLVAVGPVAWKRRAGLCLVALLAWATVLTPWTVRNYLLFDQIFYVRANYNLELWHGNIPVSSGIQTAWSLPEHPFRNPAERRQMLALGEMAYFEQAGQRFRELYARDPSAFWSKTLNRLIYLVYGDTTSRGSPQAGQHWRWRLHYLDVLIFNTAYALVGWLGVYLVARVNPRALWVVAAGALCVAPFLATHAAVTYALPLRLMFILCGGFLLWAVWQRLRGGKFPAFMTSANPLPSASLNPRPAPVGDEDHPIAHAR